MVQFAGWVTSSAPEIATTGAETPLRRLNTRLADRNLPARIGANLQPEKSLPGPATANHHNIDSPDPHHQQGTHQQPPTRSQTAGFRADAEGWV